MNQQGTQGPPRDEIALLLVEDEPALRRAYARILGAAGCQVQQVASATEAIAVLPTQVFDVVLSDIMMPGASGIDLLRKIRERDLDVPVVLITGNPSIGTAMSAVEYGALQYLVKPVENKTLVDVVLNAARFARLARIKREACLLLGEGGKQPGDRAGLEMSLSRALATLWIAWQPIVDYPARKVIGHEAFVRTAEPTIHKPAALFATAERLGRRHDPGRAIRAAVAQTLARRQPKCDIFINLHPCELFDETLFSLEAPLTRFAPQIVLELNERAVFDDGATISQRVERLRSLGFRIAIDDLGAGHAGVSGFAQLNPELVKVDLSLIRELHAHPVKRKLVGSLAGVCKELGMLVVAEGVETVQERDTLLELGCELQQGYLFARPAASFADVAW